MGVSFLASPFVCKGPTAAASWFVGTWPPCIQSPHTGRHRGSTAGFLFLVCKGTAAFSFSADKVWPGFRPEIVSAAARGKPDALLALRRKRLRIRRFRRRSKAPSLRASSSPQRNRSRWVALGPRYWEESPRRGRDPLATMICREGRLQGCKALRLLHPYSLALEFSSTTGSPASLRAHPGSFWRSSVCARTRPSLWPGPAQLLPGQAP